MKKKKKDIRTAVGVQAPLLLLLFLLLLLLLYSVIYEHFIFGFYKSWNVNMFWSPHPQVISYKIDPGMSVIFEILEIR